MRILMIFGVVIALAGAAVAGDNRIVRKAALAGVDETAEALVTAIKAAGLTVFARVDHGAGAASVGEDVGASQLVIFGSPKVGTPAIKDDPVAGLFLPLKVLVFEDATGATMIAYEDPDAMLARLGGVSADAPYLKTMAGALAKFTDELAQ